MVLSPDEVRRWADEQRSGGRTVVFTNGVFDLLHPGHVRYLQRARDFGDALIVAINSDRSARALEKGPPLSSIDNVSVRWLPPTNRFVGFDIRYSSADA